MSLGSQIAANLPFLRRYARALTGSQASGDAFVREMLDNERDRALVRGIVSLAHAFNRTVVAEGVETPAHAEALRELGCDGLQGYGIARPMPLPDLVRWIRAWQPSPEWGGAGQPVR